MALNQCILVEGELCLGEVMTHLRAMEGNHVRQLVHSYMKHLGPSHIEAHNFSACHLLRQHRQTARPFTAKPPVPKSRRQSTRTTASTNDSAELARAELAHRLRGLVRAALDSARRMAGQQPSG